MARAKQAPGRYGLVPADAPKVGGDLNALTLCGRCPDWEWYGPAREGRERFEEHRLDAHPESTDRGARARRAAAKGAR